MQPNRTTPVTVTVEPPSTPTPSTPTPSTPADDTEHRIAALEGEMGDLHALQAVVAELRARVAVLEGGK